MLKEFKEFALRGNVVDLAVGIIIGAAFTSIVNALVNDIVMPPIGLLTGNVDFADLFIDLTGGGYRSVEEAKAAGAPTINYGLFINAVINFLIVAWAVFLLVRYMNRLLSAAKKPDAHPTTKTCPECLSTIPLKARRCAQCTSPQRA